jgi:hypothetical protein
MKTMVLEPRAPRDEERDEERDVDSEAGEAEPGARRRSPLPLLIGAGALLAAAIVAVALMRGRSHDDSGAAPQASTTDAVVTPPAHPATPADSAHTIAGQPAKPESAAAVPANPLDAARADFAAGKYADAEAALKALITGGKVKGAELRAARELRARTLVRGGHADGAQRLFTTMLIVEPGYQPGSDLAADERAAFDAARTKLAHDDSLAATKKPVAAAGDGPASIDVTVVPFASLQVDGDNKGQNQKQYHLPLKPGHHVVKATHPTLGSHEWSVDIGAGESRELTYDFLASYSGKVSVSSDGGWAEIYIDGDPVHHATPWVIENVLPGKHEISVVREGFSVDGGAQSVTVKPGQQASVSFRLKKKK